MTVRKFIGDCGERIDEFKEMARTAFANDGTDQKAHCKVRTLSMLFSFFFLLRDSEPRTNTQTVLVIAGGAADVGVMPSRGWC